MQQYREEGNASTDLNSGKAGGSPDLREMVRRLALELEEKQRELERKEKIENALEKVRSQSLSMHRSEELQDVIRTVLEQLVELGIRTDTSCIVIPKEDDSGVVVWLAAKNYEYLQGFNVPWTEGKVIEDARKALSEGRLYFSRFYSLEDKNQYYNGLFTHSDLKYIPEERKAFLLAQPHFAVSVAGSKTSWIQTFNYSGQSFSEDEMQTLWRFAEVFEQCYVRFKDLQKAEAQAREVQIQLSLERVRARAMAMNQSDELSEVLSVLFEQFDALDIKPIHATLSLIDMNERVFTFYLTGKRGKRVLANSTIRFDAMDNWQEAIEKWSKGEPDEIYCSEYPPETLSKVWEVFNGVLSAIPEDARVEPEDFPNGLFMTEGYCKFGNLGFGHTRPATEEEKNIVVRFAREFGGVYQRFLDLTKVEAQALESKVEAALEKVRSRSLAMHSSDELIDVASMLFAQMKDLGFFLENAVVLIIPSEDRKSQTHFTANPDFFSATKFEVPDTDHPVFQSRALQGNLDREAARDFAEFLLTKTDYRNVPHDLKRKFREAEAYNYIIAINKYSRIVLDSWSPREFTEFERTTLHRFGIVFEQAYTRFLDLKKSEEQTREAQIQLSLERIRASATGMHHTDELSDVLTVMFEQFDRLEIKPVIAVLNLFDIANNKFVHFSTGKKGKRVLVQQTVDIHATELWQQVLVDWEKDKDHSITSIHYPKESLQQVFDLFPEIRKLPAEDIIQVEDFPDGMFQTAANCEFGNVGYIHSRESTDEEKEIVKRISREFERLYKRFLDLKKAEEQAREAEVQLALERVRAKTMAMQKQQDLLGVLDLLVEQLKKLGVQLTVALFSDGLPENDLKLWLHAIKTEGDSFTEYIHFPELDHPYFHRLRRALAEYKAGGSDFTKEVFSKEEKDSFEDYVFSQTAGKDIIPPEGKKFIYDQPGYTWSGVFLKDTWVAIARHNTIPFTEEEDELLRKFANAFGLAYSRFLDLKKAEAQTREAEIEAALERVRSKTMAMQKSEDLREVVISLYGQLRTLGFEWGAAAIVIMDRQTGDMDWWMEGFDYGYRLPQNYHVPHFEHKSHLEQLACWKSGVDFATIEVAGAEKKSFDAYYFYHTDFVKTPEATKKLMMEQETLLFSMAFMQYGALAWSPSHLTEEQSKILQRFAKVFEQSYTRFLDLQKAEAQAREAQIEASLERMRAKTMAMNNSNDVGQTVATMFGEFEHLGIHTNRCGILVFEDENFPEVWTAKSDSEGKSTMIVGKLSVNMHQLIRSAHSAWKSNVPANRYDMSGDDLISYYDAINKLDLYPAKFDLTKLPKEEFHYDFIFPEGVVFAFCPKPLDDEQNRIMKRFAGVFGQTYRRYLDLQKAEAGAREAIKQAALDRIRAEIASMRTKQDLDRITPLIWNELNILSIPFIRCGIFIMNDESHQIQAFLSTPEGKAIASFSLPYDTSKNISDVVNHWRANKTYVEHWDLNEFTSLADSLVQQGEIQTREQYMQTVPLGGMHLHFVPFMQGMLYVGNKEQLGMDNIHVLRSVADAFSTAYARYEDFNKVEKTLTDLKETQKQLIQAEKMASLGELTAGIAHEIQNPLNFVNNFSDVNSELISELREAIKSGNSGDIHELLDMIAENQEKIHHHGQRADGIVKGMLQHSRAGGNAKEPTDINALADEYLRLAFHGLRAQDKSFQSDYEFIPDTSLGKVSVVPQDIGRVLLNLINNAFYAVHVKSKSGIANYKPRVEVITKQSGDHVIITITDNGNGIPEKNREKIFQPFFTTKPTGQGTGLGLSLSYDIIQAHGGSINVESKDGEGSCFTVTLS
jgi:signal transduction histidine kinase